MKKVDLRAHYMQTLPEGERAILSAMMDEYPQTVSREWLSQETGYKPSTRNTYLQRLSARQLVEEEHGEFCASSFLYD